MCVSFYLSQLFMVFGNIVLRRHSLLSDGILVLLAQKFERTSPSITSSFQTIIETTDIKVEQEKVTTLGTAFISEQSSYLCR